MSETARSAATVPGNPDPRIVYADIIDLPRWQSPTHPHMSLYDRAAQFAPFAALTGYEDMISEEARLTDTQIELSEEEKEEISQQLSQIAEEIESGRQPVRSLTWFVPDPLKAGGKYITSTEKIRRIDPVSRRIELYRTEGNAGSRVTIDIDRVLTVSEI